jgi:hypothetical protein
MLNWLANSIKVFTIWCSDEINRCYDPFKQAEFVFNSDLAILEEKLFAHLQANHVIDGRFSYQLPMPDDSADYALFQGLYLAMLALKKSNELPYGMIGDLFVNGILVRGRRNDGTINDTTSNDSATGVLFGLWAAKDTTLIKAWAQRICDSGYALTDLKGIPTQYGQLEQGWKTDPLRITLLLAILALAGPDFEPHYEKLYAKYRLLLRYPR